MLAVVGASFAYGVGAGRRDRAFPDDLARMLGWRLVVRADPGAGYVRQGHRRLGTFGRLVSELDLARLRPAVLLVQGGHDDIGEPVNLISRRVDELLQTVQRKAPTTRVGIVPVFVKPHLDRPIPLEAVDTSQAIVSAAKLADPAVMVFNPIAGHWRFARMHGRLRLHPDAAGHREIAEKLFNGLRKQMPLTCPAHPSASYPCRVVSATAKMWPNRLLTRVAAPRRSPAVARVSAVSAAAAKVSADHGPGRKFQRTLIRPGRSTKILLSH